MSHRFFIPKYVACSATFLAAVAMLAGCVSSNFEPSITAANALAAEFTPGQLSLVQSPAQRDALAQTAAELLQKPVDQSDALRLVLVNSPTVQAMLAQHWADAARAAQSGRISNPVLTLERLRFADGLELGRLLVFGLLDVLTLPQRAGAAQRQMHQVQLRLGAQVIAHLTQVRGVWVKAVAAQQTLLYAKQVHDVAQVSSELAQRMQAAGNFTKLQRARQHAFYADAAAGWASAQQANTAAREALVRLLGLTDAQAAQLVLPERLPDLPEQLRSADAVGQQASRVHLEIQLAKAEFEALAKAQGLTLLTSLTDIELGLRRDTDINQAAGTSTPKRGVELSVRLPLFDWGEHQREAMNAQTLAAANRLEATTRAAGSHLRESYAAYLSAFNLSKHYRDEVLPLRKTISKENLLRYNGMLIGVFELLADSREQISSVMAAIAAQQQFWLADAALQAALMGKPVAATAGIMPQGAGSEAGH
jgi:outer membrane protein TolC